MRAEMYEITPCPQGRLATMPRPRGGEWLIREIASMKASGVTDVVSLLTPPEVAELGLQLEAQACAAAEIGFHILPVGDRGIPPRPAFDAFIDTLVPILQHGGFIAVHCRAGIGRSTVVAAALVIRLGVSAQDAITLISNARGFDVPDTEDQLDFIFSLEHPLA
jgi:protein-tyrosine phosphatase